MRPMNSLRIAVYLPVTGDPHRRAATLALKALRKTFEDWSVIGVGNATECRHEDELALLGPAVHGLWRDRSGRLWHDSHIVFIAHLAAKGKYENQSEQLDLAMEIELMAYLWYGSIAREVKRSDVYQRLVFVEVWTGAYVEAPNRIDISTILTGPEPDHREP